MAAPINISKREPSPGSLEEAEGILTATATHLQQGSITGAFLALRLLWKYPGAALHSQEIWPRALRLMADTCRASDPADSLTCAAEAVAVDTMNPQSLHIFAVAFMRHREFELAATTLLLAHRISTRDQAVFVELIAALSKNEQYGEAIQHLQASPAMLEELSVCRSQFVWNAIMIGDLKLARQAYARLAEMRQQSAGIVNDECVMSSMLSRADKLEGISPLDRQDLRGWHYVLNGGLLLQVSPYGLNEGMNGRYCWVRDSAAKCHEAIQRLKEVLKVQGVTSPRIFILPELRSSILAHALAKALDSSTVPWPQGGSRESGLIVAYDLELLPPETRHSLFAYHPGQLLWAHALCWTDKEPWLPRPDFVSFLYQTLVSPWEDDSSMRASAVPVQPNQDEKLVPENQQILAGQILEAELEVQLGNPLEDLPSLIALAKLMKSDLVEGAQSCSQYRTKQIPGSPVPSSRF